MEARSARARTLSALGSSRARRAGATPAPRWARPVRRALLALAAAAALGCSPYVQGNGVYREESRPAQPFQGIRVEDGIEATVTAGAAQPSIVVSADENFVAYMKTDFVQEPSYGQVLHVWIDMESWSSTNPPRVRVEVPQLRLAAVSGDSHLTASEVSAPALRLEAAEKSSLWVSGAGGGSIDVVANDSAVHAEAYAVSTSATVDLSTGAKAWLRSDAPVTGTVRAGCTLDNMLGTGTCSGLTLEGGPTILCNP